MTLKVTIRVIGGFEASETWTMVLRMTAVHATLAHPCHTCSPTPHLLAHVALAHLSKISWRDLRRPPCKVG